jgi:ribosomal protein S18 acetylase RimI-like enzyme
MNFDLLNCKKITNFEISEIVRIHLNVYGHGHFTGVFGPKLLRRYYEAIFGGRDKIVVLARESDAIAGFAVAGSGFKREINYFLRRNLFSVAFLFLANPVFLFKRVLNGFQSNKKLNSESQPDGRLFSIAVDGKYQKHGVASGMIGVVEEYFIANDIFCYGLSVRKANSNAICAYENLGFEKSGSNREVVYYKKRLFKKNN